MKKIDLNTWNRREHYAFFKSFDEPYFSFVADVDATHAWKISKATGKSFFSAYLFCSLAAVNATEAFRLRIHDGDVVEYPVIHATSTIGRADGTFGFSFIPWHTDYVLFDAALQAEIAAVKQSTGLRFNDEMMRQDVIHYSSIPWLAFTSLSHPRKFDGSDSVPKVTFGKLHAYGSKQLLPVGVHAHHGLMDGYHVGLFFEAFQQQLSAFG